MAGYWGISPPMRFPCMTPEETVIFLGAGRLNFRRRTGAQGSQDAAHDSAAGATHPFHTGDTGWKEVRLLL